MNNLDNKKNRADRADLAFTVLLVSFFLCGFMRALTVLWTPPSVTSLLWDESLFYMAFERLSLDRLGLDRLSYIQSEILSFLISHAGTYFGTVLFSFSVLGVISVTAIRSFNLSELYNKLFHKLLKLCTYIVSVHIFTVVFLKFVGRGYQIPQLIEWGIQFLSPIIFYLYFSGKIKASYRLALAAVAMTFLGHGIYALGLGVGVPSYFLDMTISFFGFSENWARSYLMVAGILDMLILGACVFYFTKSFSSDNSKIFKNSYLNNLGMALIMWACVWGAVTAFARVIVIPHKELGDEVLYWAFETMVRLPHALIPLFVLIMLKNGLADSCAKSRD